MTVLLLSTLAFGAPCPTAVPLTGWTSTLVVAEEAYRSFDAARFDDTLDTAALDLRCLADVVTTDAAARYHVLSGLRLYTRSRIGDAVAEFSAARAADPDFVIDPSLVPLGHELRALVPASVEGPTEPLAPPADGVTVALDGTPSTARPVDRPVIVQIVRTGGLVDETTYLLPGEPMPAYPVQTSVPVPVPVGLDPVVPLPEPVPRVARKPRWGALAAAGVAAGTSAALYALAARSEAKFNAELEPEFGKDDLFALRNRTNALVWGSVISGSLAAGGMVVFVVPR